MEDAKQEVQTLDIDAQLDAKMDELEQETPAESSPAKETEDTEPVETEEPSAEDDKTEVPDDTTEDVPTEFHKHPAWQRIIKERDEARQAIEAQKTDSPVQSELDKFKEVTSSAAYIQASMQAQGYRQEAIDLELQRQGHNVPDRRVDDVSSFLEQYNLTKEAIPQENLQLLQDYDKFIDYKLNRFKSVELPEHLKPIEQRQTEIAQSNNASRLISEMQSIVKTEGILDYGKDVEPELNKWVEAHPEATQEAVYQQFKDLNHSLTIERLKLGGKRKERANEVAAVNPLKPGATVAPGHLPEPTGDVSKDLDAAMDVLGVEA
jgi:hypothetical protein